MVRLIGFVCLLASVAVSRHAVWGDTPSLWFGDTTVLGEIPWYGCVHSRLCRVLCANPHNGAAETHDRP